MPRSLPHTRGAGWRVWGALLGLLLMPIDDVVTGETVIPAVAPPLQGALQASPYNFAFTGEDALRLTVHNAQSGVVVAVHYRMQARDGRIVANRHTFVPTSDRVATVSEFSIGDGYLLNCTVFVSTGTPVLGQTFAKVQVIRGRATAATVLGTIVQGCVTAQNDLGWPGSPLRSPQDYAPYPRAVTGTNPAALDEVSETVPAGARWLLQSIAFTLQTSSGGGNRRPKLLINGGGFDYVIAAPSGTQAASLLYGYSFAVGFPGAGAVVDIYVNYPLPHNLWVPAGLNISTQTTGMTAGDNYSAPVLLVAEQLEVA